MDEHAEIEYIDKASLESDYDENDVVDHAEVDVERTCSRHSLNWNLMGKSCHRSALTFVSQVIILYIVVLTCLANLTIGSGEMKVVWISLLSSSLGILLPSPRMGKRSDSEASIKLN